ncbi:MAG: hypothetical protein EBR10_07555 [Planctomycetes bacterium]|nr:hypothetical protein [Planctomycetota bacterium]
MISRIEGTLERVGDDHALVAVGALAYEVSIPAADVQRLQDRLGETVLLHTLHYLESQGQGASFWPRLIGFQSEADRDFFELVTSVKGIGVRRALRALTIPFPRVAEAIVRKDLGTLVALPEIGRKTAETMVLELRDKVERHAMRSGGAPVAAPSNTPSNAPLGRTAAAKGRRAAAVSASAPGAMPAGAPPISASAVLDAVHVLVQLGENRLDARSLIDAALERAPEIASADALVAAALALKGVAR